MLTLPIVDMLAFSLRTTLLTDPLICPRPVKMIVELPGMNAPPTEVAKFPPTVILGDAAGSISSVPNMLTLPLTRRFASPPRMMSLAPAAIANPPMSTCCKIVRKTGLLTVEGMTTLSALLGTPGGLQFPGLDQRESNTPVHVLIGRGEIAEQMIVPPRPVANTTPPVDDFRTCTSKRELVVGLQG